MINSNSATAKCILCGELATCHHGHVLGKEKMALGNYVDIKIIAGFCATCDNIANADENGCYGNYDNTKHGLILNLFRR